MRRGGTESPNYFLRISAEQPRYSLNTNRYKSVSLNCDYNRNFKRTAFQPIYIRAGKNKRAE